jgi:hypothetical protein
MTIYQYFNPMVEPQGQWFDEGTGHFSYAVFPEEEKSSNKTSWESLMIRHTNGASCLDWRIKSEKEMQYYYATGDDIEKCWHDEGTGPYPNTRFENPIDGYKTYVEISPERHIVFHWREKVRENVNEDVLEPDSDSMEEWVKAHRDIQFKMKFPMTTALKSEELDEKRKEIILQIYRCGYHTAEIKHMNDFPRNPHTHATTEEDADENGWVQVLTDKGWEVCFWAHVDGRKWLHTPYWKPETDEVVVNKALEALTRIKVSANSTTPLYLGKSNRDLEKIARALHIAKKQLNSGTENG